MRRWVTVLVLTGALGSACSSDVASGAELEAVEDEPRVLEFQGVIVAVNATDLRAPQNSIRIGGWASNSSWIELQELAEDGAEVKKGDVVGRFEFRGKEALPRVKEAIAQAEADLEQASVSDTSTLDEIEATILRSEVEARQAELDLQRGTVVSGREMQQFELTRRLAEFDASANKKYAKAQQAARTAEQEFRERNVAQSKADMDRFEMYKRRFAVKAPHDGVVRHAYHVRRRRKVQKGDGMPSGMHFASVAADNAVGVEVYVPERYYQMLKTTKTFQVRSPTSDEAVEATVQRIEEFPQTLGFVREDNNLPNARDRVYVVRASFEEMPAGLASGLEVKVTP